MCGNPGAFLFKTTRFGDRGELAGWLAGWLAEEKCSREDCCKKRRGTSREERDKLRGVIRQAPYKRRTARSGVSQ
jgi:hypothetical protein